MVVAELFAYKTWTPIELSVALTIPRTRRMRCPECKGRIRAHKEGSDGQKAHMEHYEAHTGCSRGNSFNGEVSHHPRALG